jgi:hypothetical protein
MAAPRLRNEASAQVLRRLVTGEGMRYCMIPKSGYRFSEKIMLQQ